MTQRPVASSRPQSAQQAQHKPAGNGQQSAQPAAAETPILDKIITQQHTFTPLGEDAEISLSAWHVYTYLAKPTKSGKMPGNDDCIKFTIMCRQRKLNPWTGDCYLLGYDTNDGPQFTIITAHQALLSRAELHPSYEGMQSGVIVSYMGKDATGNDVLQFEEREGDLTYSGETLLGGWAKVFRSDRKLPSYQRLKLQTYDKGLSQWKKDPAGMICKCFDEQTEVLTTRGFQKFAEVTGHILQVDDHHGLTPVSVQPFSQDYDGDMVVMDSDDLNFAVTPNHDMILTSGKMEAGAMYNAARSRISMWIPRLVKSTRPDVAISDDAIALAAAYLCDGQDHSGGKQFGIAVSRQRKIDALNAIGLFHNRGVRAASGDIAITNTGRVITSTKDKTVFSYRYESMGGLVAIGRQVNWALLSALSARQARIFADSMIEFDGHVDGKSGVRRFFQSRLEVLGAFELASVLGGYAVSERKPRESDGGTKPNFCVTISERNEIGIRRWGRFHNYEKQGQHDYVGLERRPNVGGKVWCVTVPSGVIVVRRNGFSMLCGNCSEAAALRQAFPSVIGGMYLRDEVDAFQSRGGKEPSQRTGQGGAVDLDVLTGSHASGQLPAGVGQQQPAGDESTQEPSPDDSNQESLVQAGTEAFGGEQDDDSQDEESGSGTGPVSSEEEFTNWQFDIDQAATNGALDKLAEDCAKDCTGHLRIRVMEAIAKRRTALAGGNIHPQSASKKSNK